MPKEKKITLRNPEIMCTGDDIPPLSRGRAGIYFYQIEIPISEMNGLLPKKNNATKTVKKIEITLKDE